MVSLAAYKKAQLTQMDLSASAELFIFERCPQLLDVL